MSLLTAEQALEMVFMSDADDLDSGGELDIEEDPALHMEMTVVIRR